MAGGPKQGVIGTVESRRLRVDKYIGYFFSIGRDVSYLIDSGPFDAATAPSHA